MAVVFDYKIQWFTNGTLALFDYVVNSSYDNDLVTFSMDWALQRPTLKNPVRGMSYDSPLEITRCHCN